MAYLIRFLAYLMTYGTLSDIAGTQRYLELADFRRLSITRLMVGPSSCASAQSWPERVRWQ